MSTIGAQSSFFRISKEPRQNLVTLAKADLRLLHMSRRPPETTTNLNETALPSEDIRVLRQKAPQARRGTSSGDPGKSKRPSDHFSAGPKNVSKRVNS